MYGVAANMGGCKLGERVVGGWFLAVALVAVGCGKAPDKRVLARVGDVTITVADFDTAAAKVPPEAGGPTRDDPKSISRFLETLVDKELLVREVRTGGYDEDGRVLAKLEEKRNELVFSGLQEKEIAGKVVLTEEELREVYTSEKFDREWRLSGIFCATVDSAYMLIDRARAGEDFAELARIFAKKPDAREKAPDTGFFRKSARYNEIFDTASDLEIGEVEGPISVRQGLAVIKVTDIRDVSFEDARETVELVLRPRKQAERIKEVRKMLRDRVDVQLDTAVVELAWDKLRDSGVKWPEPTPAEDSLLIARWDGQSANMKELFDYMEAARVRRALKDSTKLWQQVENMVVINHLLPAYFVEQGYDQDPAFIETLKNYRMEVAVTNLKHDEVDSRITYIEEDVKAFYEANPDLFMSDEQVTVLEILSKTRDESLALRDSIWVGLDMKALAERHSTRETTKPTSGVLGPFKRGRYGRLGEMAFAATPDSLVGPVLTEEGYSLFKVIEKILATVMPYEQYKARQKYRKSEESRLFSELLERLREKYADIIDVEPYVENQRYVLRDQGGELATEGPSGPGSGS